MTHNGLFTRLREALEFYRASAGFPDNGRKADEMIADLDAFKAAVNSLPSNNHKRTLLLQQAMEKTDD